MPDNHEVVEDDDDDEEDEVRVEEVDVDRFIFQGEWCKIDIENQLEGEI